MTYEWLLMQLRVLADSKGDERSLVAIAAHFERNHHHSLPPYINEAVAKLAHCRNNSEAA